MKKAFYLMVVTIILALTSQSLLAQVKTEIYFSNPEWAKKFQEIVDKDSAKGDLGEVTISARSTEDGLIRSNNIAYNRRRVEKGEKFGYEDSTKKVVIPCQYDFGKDFKNGAAVVGKRNAKGSAVSYYQWHIDRNGKPLYSTSLYCDVHDFVNGYAIVDVTGSFKMCHIKRDGTPAYPERYTYCYNFNKKDRAIVERAIPSKDIVRYMVIDTKGTVLGWKEYSFDADRAKRDNMTQVQKDLDKWLNPAK